MTLEEEFVQYLKQIPSMDRFIKACIKQYEKLERIGGEIKLSKIDAEEAMAIGEFLHMYFPHDKDVKVKFQAVEQAIKKTKFESCDLVEVLRLYKGSDFHFKKKEKQKEEAAFFSFCDEIGNQEIGKARAWWYHMLETNKKGIKALWKENSDALKIVVTSVQHLPVWNHKVELLAVFAQTCSKDPHFFDINKHYTLLLSAISYYFYDGSIPEDLKGLNELLFQGGLLKDDISNFCMICHINALQETGDHPAWKGFYDAYEPWIINTYNLNQITSLVLPNRVYILENPSTFRTLCMKAKEAGIDDVGFVCTYGQLNFSAYQLLDQMMREEVLIYYSGDFDPEGLLIADNIKQRYPSIALWHYQVSDYEQAISKKEIDETRMQKLKNIRSEELEPLIQRLTEIGYAGYQESLHDLYMEDIGSD